MYRDIRKTADNLEQAGTHIDRALLAEDTSTISTEAGTAQAIVLEVLQTLKSSLEDQDSGDVNRELLQSAINALDLGWVHAEKVALGTDVRSMREEVLSFKTHADHAAAFLQASLGIAARA